jgi:hypothetical protein
VSLRTGASQLIRRYVKPALRRVWPRRHLNLNGIRVNYFHSLDGGGIAFGQDYIPYLRNRGMPCQERTFEWCAGPGFIGFSLLGCGLTKTLCLADINPSAVAACRRSINDNALAARVDVYQSDNLVDIPQWEKWDLVVGNPPHFGDEQAASMLLHDPAWRIHPLLLLHDPGWRIHREFFSQVGAHLKPGGVIVLQENSQGSTTETFREMIEEAGLEIAFVEFGPRHRTEYGHIYYVGVVRRGDAVPRWAKGAIFSSS